MNVIFLNIYLDSLEQISSYKNGLMHVDKKYVIPEKYVSRT
jgi:hypothetical protein